MLVARRSDADDLNHRARQLIANHLGPDLLATDRTTFAQGDHVIGLRNDYHSHILNGTRATITGRTRNGDLQLQFADGSRRIAPHRYIEDGHLTHGYALTIHKAQGITVDSAFLLGDDSLYAELGYTGLSRGRTENRFYTVVNRDELGHATADPLQHVRTALDERHAQHAAIDHPLGISR